MKISTILDKIDENQLFVPAFQREYVWKRDDAKQLVDSLVKQYPTGTMLTWETSSPPELKGPYRYDTKQGAVRILLDGQQRITTLYMLIRGNIPRYYSKAEITNDTRGLFVNLETLELSYYMKTRMENDPLWQDITHVFQKKVRAKDVVRELERKGQVVDRERDDRIDDNTRAIENILDRDFPEQTVPVKATIREAIDIFYKVNASGVALTEAELALAQISGYWPQARDLFKEKLRKLAESGFVFNLDFIVYSLLGCLYHLGSDMRKLHAQENDEKLRKTWEILDTKVLDYVANLLRTNAYVDHSDEINSVYALIPVIVFCFDKGHDHPNDQEIRRMVKWFYYSQLRSRYVSQLPQKLDRDLRVIQESSNPFDELLRGIEEESRLTITANEFEGRAIQHPLFSMVRWYFKSLGAVCLTTGIGLRHPMGKKYQLEKDHIFPYVRLKKAGYGKENRVKYSLAQELTNRSILTQVANRNKSGSTAAEYLRTVRKRFPNALALQCIPENEELWEIEKYKDFLQARRELLASNLNQFLEEITDTNLETSPVPLEDLISQGESDDLEFKATFRWDIQENRINKKLEEVVVKSVAAFSNGQGGTLLVGVDDEGNVQGLGYDFESLNGDRDRFEVHLRNVLTEHFGAAFVATRLKIAFPAIAGKHICQIDISSSADPVIVRFKDKNGQPVERFFVRSGNSSQELPLSEMHQYLKERFK